VIDLHARVRAANSAKPPLTTSTAAPMVVASFALALVLAAAVASSAYANELAPVPILGSPDSGAVLQTPAPSFEWTSSSDTGEQCVEYQLVVSIPRRQLTSIDIIVSESRYVPDSWKALLGTPGESIDYDWRVRARFCNEDWSAWSDESRFSIETPNSSS